MGATPASLLATVFAPCLGGAWGLGEPRGPGPAGGSLDQDPAGRIRGVQVGPLGAIGSHGAFVSLNTNPAAGGGDTLSRGSRGVDIPPFP